MKAISLLEGFKFPVYKLARIQGWIFKWHSLCLPNDPAQSSSQTRAVRKVQISWWKGLTLLGNFLRGLWIITSTGCSETGVFFPNLDLSTTGQQWATQSAPPFHTCVSSWSGSRSCSQPCCAGSGSDPTGLMWEVGGSCSGHSLWLWSIRGTLEEMLFLEGDFRPLYCIRNSGRKALLKGNTRHSVGALPGQGNLRHLFTDKHVAAISTAEGHWGNLLPDSRAHETRGLQMARPAPHWNMARATAYPASTGQAPGCTQRYQNGPSSWLLTQKTPPKAYRNIPPLPTSDYIQGQRKNTGWSLNQ